MNNKERIKEIYRYYKILKNKQSNFRGEYSIKKDLVRLKISINFKKFFMIFTPILILIQIFIIYQFEFSTLNYIISSVYHLINFAIIFSLHLNNKKLIKELEENIEYSLEETFTKAERNQFLRLKKLKNINNTKSE